jgi:hypothetical protein
MVKCEALAVLAEEIQHRHGHHRRGGEDHSDASRDGLLSGQSW